MADKIDYHQTVDYSQADPAKVLAQQEGLATASNMPYGFREVSGTRGESGYVFQMGDSYGALVQEGLGSKSLITQAVYAKTGVSYFGAVAQDTVACIINDLVSVGATPVVLNAYWSASSYEWLTDHTLTTDFIKGWRAACDLSGVVWGGGETQSLSGVVAPGSLEFAGSAFGVIQDKKRLISGDNLHSGDAIVLIEASGVHANGISLVREIAGKLPDGYQTKLADGSTYGETALIPTHLYAKLVEALFTANVDVHYLSNITGHGWRKLMRATPEFTYRMHTVTPVHEIFNFIAEKSGNDEIDMYGNFNMGAGYAVYVPAADAEKVVEVAKAQNLQAWTAGVVETGPKQVIIEPNGITFAGDTLEVR
jgi:phosphoribosylformylglycinamidine cyclo-ligase